MNLTSPSLGDDPYWVVAAAFEAAMRQASTPMDRVFDSYRGLCMQYACYQAECEQRLFAWIDTRSLCTFKCRCPTHETNSVTARG